MPQDYTGFFNVTYDSITLIIARESTIYIAWFPIPFLLGYTYDRLEQATNSYETEKNLYGDTSMN